MAPLTGIEVLDAGGATTAYAAKVLWDLGAEVTVLEPSVGHDLRHRPPFDHREPSRSLLFDWYHGGSRLWRVEPTDDDALTAIARAADVVLIAPGFSPYPVVGERPSWAPTGAVVCSVTPFGRGGPYDGWRATHLTSCAVSGGMIRFGPEDGPPLVLPGQLQWDVTGLHAALSVLAALRARPWAGGQSIDISAQEVEAPFDYYFEQYSTTGEFSRPRSTPNGIPPTGIWQCADGQLEISAHQKHHWGVFLDLLGHPDELGEPALADMAIRRELADGVAEVIARLLSNQARLDLFARAQALGLPSSVVNTPRQFASDEQLAARKVIVAREIRGRTMHLPCSPVRGNAVLSRHGCVFGAPAPSPDRDQMRVSSRPQPVAGPLPLSGVRVVSLGAFLAGNMLAGILAGFGAEVVKIEAAARAESLRGAAYGFAGLAAREPSGATTTEMFASLARGARNVSLDVKHPAGAELFRHLVAESDVVLENFGAQTMARWGFGFDVLAGLQPKIVQVAMSGYGRTGPRGGYVAYAGNISSFTGLSYLQSRQGQFSDCATAAYAAAAVFVALDEAQRLGRAIHVDVGQTDVMATLLAPCLLDPLVNNVDTLPRGNAVAGSEFSGVYACKGDDAWVAIEAPTLGECSRLAALTGASWAAGESGPAPADRAALDEAVRAWCLGLTAHSAALLLQRAGVAAGAVQGFEDVARDPQLRHRRFPARLLHPDLGPMEYPGSPHRLSATPPIVVAPAERLGASTREVLSRWLGTSRSDLDALEASGAIACHP